MAYAQLMDYALRLLGQRPYTVAALREKLALWAGPREKNAKPGGKPMLRRVKTQNVLASPSEHTIDAVMARLLELGVLNDLDYCRRWVDERSRHRPRGQFLLNRELRHKGVTLETLKAFWEQTEGCGLDEAALARRLIEERLPRLKARYQGRALRDRLYRFLVSRGIRHDMISAAMDERIPGILP